MDYLIKEKKLKLKYQPGKGAWTYHVQIPGTKHIVGKWGSLKVSGFIDDYKIESINLFTLKGQDKLISINDKIRKAINKTGGDTVKVTLYLVNTREPVSGKRILETFKESGVLPAFKKLPAEERAIIIDSIIGQRSEDKQIKTIIKCIDKLVKN